MIKSWAPVTPELLAFIVSDGRPLSLARRLVPHATLKDQWKAVICVYMVNNMSKTCPIGYFLFSGFIQFSTNTDLENNFQLAEYVWTAFEDRDLEATLLALISSQVDNVTQELVYLSEILEIWAQL